MDENEPLDTRVPVVPRVKGIQVCIYRLYSCVTVFTKRGLIRLFIYRMKTYVYVHTHVHVHMYAHII